MLIAETVQFEIPAWVVALVLAVLLLLVAALVAFVLVGFKAAARAGKGSQNGMFVFCGVVGIEAFLALYALAQRGFWMFWVIPLTLAGLHVFTYFDVRRTGGGDG